MAPRTDTAESKGLANIAVLGVVAPPPIHVESPHFQGSLGLLFRYVKESKVNLLEIPVFPICEAYFKYLLETELAEIDEAAAALAALAYLIERKAWLLLPVPEPEPELEESMELPEATSHEYQAAIEVLRLWHEERSHLFFSSVDAGPDPYELPFSLGQVGPGDLARAFARALERAKPDPLTPPNRPRRSLSEQMGIVLLSIGRDWKSLDRLVPEDATRTDVVYWFLALLELIRLGQVSVQVDGEEPRFARAERRSGGASQLDPGSVEHESAESVPGLAGSPEASNG
jgi:segregation and condensation protein A